MRTLRFIPDETNINFIGKRMFAYAVSLFLMCGTIFLLFTQGLNFGIDFTGGTVIEIKVDEAPDLSVMRTDLSALGMGDISIQEFGAAEDLLIRLPEQKEDAAAKQKREECLRKNTNNKKLCPLSPQETAINAIHKSLDQKFDGKVDYRRTEFVGPQVGKELKKTAIMAVIFSLISILGYLWFRFEWQFGIAAILSTAHDVIATLGLFALTQMQFDLSTLAAILLIAGYSINDTVVVFDRIRENLRKFRKMPLLELCNRCVNQTLSRTLLTSGTTLLALIALWSFGGEVIRGFVNALIFGILLGTFSSIYVAAPMLNFMKLRREGDNSTEDAVPDNAEPQQG